MIRTSLPSRERGLKSVSLLRELQVPPSLPSRERGLKLEIDGSYGTHSRVAPLTGVWIEIDIAEAYGVNEAVAPLTGAWIEIQE